MASVWPPAEEPEEEEPQQVYPLREPAAQADPAPGVRGRRHRSQLSRRRFALSFSTSVLGPDGLPVVGAREGSAESALARLLAATAAQAMPGGGVPPAEPDVLETLQRIVPSEANNAPCAICLDEMTAEEADRSCARLPRCMHTFHEDCLLPWLRDCHATCPTCRTPLAEEPPPPPPPATPPASDAAANGTETAPVASTTTVFSASTEDDAHAPHTTSPPRPPPSSHLVQLPPASFAPMSSGTRIDNSRARTTQQPVTGGSGGGGGGVRPRHSALSATALALASATADLTGAIAAAGRTRHHHDLRHPPRSSTARSAAAASAVASGERADRSEEPLEREWWLGLAAEAHATRAPRDDGDRAEDALLREVVAAAGLRASWEHDDTPPCPARPTTRGGGHGDGGSSRSRRGGGEHRLDQWRAAAAGASPRPEAPSSPAPTPGPWGRLPLPTRLPLRPTF